MKKTLLPIAILVLGSTAFAQVENGNFENWNELSLFAQPSMEFDAASSNFEIFIETGQTNVTEVEHENGSAMRLENIETGEGVNPAFYLLGGTPNQSGEDMVFPGGVSASDPNVTGISVDMAYDFPGESSGFVIVQFKMNEMPVGPGTMGTGTFFFPISGQQDWEDEVFDFETSIGVEYDRVVIGFATADLIGSDSDFPAGPWMEIDNLSFVNSTDEILNGDFELWAQVPPVLVPAKVEVEVDLLNPTFIQSNDVAEGQFALGLITRDFDGFTEPTRAMIGSSEVEGGVPTIDLNENDAVLSFDYKYATENDVAEVQITFYEEAGESLLPVYGKSIDLGPTTAYESVQYSFLDDLEENFVTATKMSVQFSSSKEESPQGNSMLLIDNVELSGALGVLNPRKTDGQIRITAYPNPTIGRTSFVFGVERTGFYRVYNNQGHQIDLVSFQNKKYLTHNLQPLPAGQYTFRFYHEGGVRTARVIKN